MKRDRRCSYSSGNLPDAKVLFSPRVGFNWDVAGNQQTQVRGGTGIFTGPPLYVWISNQLGNTGVLQGSLLEDNPTTRPFHPDIDRYKPANVTGAPAASYELNVTDNNFKFPQVLEEQHRRRSPAALGHHRHRGVHLQQGRQRHLLHQRQPAGGAVRVHGRRHAGPDGLEQRAQRRRRARA